ncbi:MAG: hypothetical protein JJ975_01980 [Bacteroidia bacterium]|nr:hypothetical protein [Bacteroidia bacterium]
MKRDIDSYVRILLALGFFTLTQSSIAQTPIVISIESGTTLAHRVVSNHANSGFLEYATKHDVPTWGYVGGVSVSGGFNQKNLHWYTRIKALELGYGTNRDSVLFSDPFGNPLMQVAQQKRFRYRLGGLGVGLSKEQTHYSPYLGIDLQYLIRRSLTTKVLKSNGNSSSVHIRDASLSTHLWIVHSGIKFDLLKKYYTRFQGMVELGYSISSALTQTDLCLFYGQVGLCFTFLDKQK